MAADVTQVSSWRAPLGHAVQEQLLLALLADHKLPQTLLFHGAKGIGKASFAKQLSCYLLAGGDGQAGLFGEASMALPENSPTVARVLAHSHADFLLIEPEFSGQNQTPIIKVDAARKVADFFSKTAGESSWRVALIDGADALNVNAANALLKIVEEPPLNGVLILVAHQAGKLLPTLLSRCRKLAFKAPDEATFFSIMQEHHCAAACEDLRALYVLCAGSPGRALFLDSLDLTQAYRGFLDLLDDYPHKSATKVSKIAAQLEKQVKNGAWAPWCELWLLLLERLNLAAVDALEAGAFDGEIALLQRVSAQHSTRFWQDLHAASRTLVAQAHGLHLDRKQVIQSLISMAFNELELAAS